MDSQDYIKEAIGLADGWGVSTDDYYYGPLIVGSHISKIGASAKAALAAQLTEQVDATDYRLDIGPTGTVLYEPQGGMFESPGLNSDRAMNTIKVIVDSRVLKEPITAKAADNNTE